MNVSNRIRFLPLLICVWHAFCNAKMRMKKCIFIIVFAAVAGGAFAQPPQESPQRRTPEEIALKQNAMLARELGLTDSIQLDTLYRMHLKYAKLRAISNTRAEDIERLQAMTQELKSILTAEQYQQFMDHQVDDRPRGPHSQAGSFPQWREVDTVPPPHEGPHRPERP